MREPSLPFIDARPREKIIRPDAAPVRDEIPSYVKGPAAAFLFSIFVRGRPGRHILLNALVLRQRARVAPSVEKFFHVSQL